MTSTIADQSAAHLIKYNCNVTLTNQLSLGRFFHLPYLSVNNAAQRLSHAAADLSLVKIIIAHSHMVVSLTPAVTYVNYPNALDPMRNEIFEPFVIMNNDCLLVLYLLCVRNYNILVTLALIHL